jgi:hypothetical protein
MLFGALVVAGWKTITFPALHANKVFVLSH